MLGDLVEDHDCLDVQEVVHGFLLEVDLYSQDGLVVVLYNLGGQVVDLSNLVVVLCSLDDQVAALFLEVLFLQPYSGSFEP